MTFAQVGGGLRRKHTEEPPKRSYLIEIIGSIVVPLAASIAAATQRDRVTVLVLAGVAVLSLVVTGYRPFRAAIRSMRRKLRRRALARHEWPTLHDFTDRLGLFFQDRTDTLHYVLKYEVIRDTHEREKLFSVWDSYFFRDLASELHQRVEYGPTGYNQLVRRLSELQTLLNAYHRYCMEPVFERLPDEVRLELTSRAEASLEDVRERLTRYRDDLEAFVRRIAASGEGDLVRQFYVPRVKPLRRGASA